MCSHGIGQSIEELTKGLGIGPHQALGVVPGPRAAAFDQVAGECERGSGETQHRNGGPLAQDPQGLEGGGEVPENKKKGIYKIEKILVRNGRIEYKNKNIYSMHCVFVL